MITPKPKLVEPVMAFEPANEFYGDHLQISEEEEFIGPNFSAEPFILIGYDGQAWRVQEFWETTETPKSLLDIIFTWNTRPNKSTSFVGREVTPVYYSLEEFKSEVCRRIPGNPNAIFGDDTMAGEGLPRGVEAEEIGPLLIEKVCAAVQTATSIGGVMDVLLVAQQKGDEWAREFARAQLSAP